MGEGNVLVSKWMEAAKKDPFEVINAFMRGVEVPDEAVHEALDLVAMKGQ